jgi:hypothetical protein
MPLVARVLLLPVVVRWPTTSSPAPAAPQDDQLVVSVAALLLVVHHHHNRPVRLAPCRPLPRPAGPRPTTHVRRLVHVRAEKKKNKSEMSAGAKVLLPRREESSSHAPSCVGLARHALTERKRKQEGNEKEM